MFFDNIAADLLATRRENSVVVSHELGTAFGKNTQSRSVFFPGL